MTTYLIQAVSRARSKIITSLVEGDSATAANEFEKLIAALVAELLELQLSLDKLIGAKDIEMYKQRIDTLVELFTPKPDHNEMITYHDGLVQGVAIGISKTLDMLADRFKE